MRARTRSVGKSIRLSDLKSHRTLIAKDLRTDPLFRREWKRTTFARAVAIKVLQHRSLARLTQEQLAQKLDMKQSAISRLELGEVAPSFATLLKLAEGLKIEFVVDISPRKKFRLVTSAAEKQGVKSTTPEGSRVLVAAG